MQKLSSGERTQRSPLLDILRVLLCSGVVFFHFTPIRPACGSYMVLGFFVLSGFLLGLHFERENEFDVAKFYSGKARRLLPVFVVAMLLAVIVKIFCHFVKPVDFPLLPPYSSAEWGDFSLARFLGFYNAPAWFMATEFFMLLCAPVMFWVYKKRCGVFIMLLVCMAMSCFLYRQVPYSSDHACGLYYSPLVRSWQFVAGMAAARVLMSFSGKGSACRKTMADICCVLLSLVFISLSVVLMIVKQREELNFWNYTFDFEMIVVLMFSLLIPLLHSRCVNVGGRVGRALTYAALLTYPVYLIHVPFYLSCKGGLTVLFGEGLPNACLVIVTVLTMLVVSAIMLYVIKLLMEKLAESQR